MNTYTLYWRGGKRELVTGYNYGNALARAGLFTLELGALDFFVPGDDTHWEWDAKRKLWHCKKPEAVAV